MRFSCSPSSVHTMASSTTKAIGIRMKNEDLETLDKIVELGGFESRGECLRLLLRPTFDMCTTAINTKSKPQTFYARLKAEKALMKAISQMIKNAEGQTELDLSGMPPELKPIGGAPA